MEDSYMYPEDKLNHFFQRVCVFVCVCVCVCVERATRGWASSVTEALAHGSAHAEAVCDEWGLPGQKTRAAAKWHEMRNMDLSTATEKSIKPH